MMEEVNIYRIRYKWQDSDFAALPEGNINSVSISIGQYEDSELPVKFYQNPQFPSFRITPIITTGVPYSILVSDELVTLLRLNGLTGWSTYPIILRDSSGEYIPGFQGFSVFGKAGKFQLDKSEKKMVQFSKMGPKVPVYKGLYPDMNAWDDSDIFRAEDSLDDFCTEKFKNSIQQNDSFKRHFIFENVKEIEVMQSLFSSNKERKRFRLF